MLKPFKVFFHPNKKVEKKQDLIRFHHIPFIISLYFLAYVIVFGRPLDVQQWQWADDALFFNNANAILNNFGEAQWLGPFTEVLLAKTPFFPIFIAFSLKSGIPLRFLEFLLYAPLPFLFLLSVRPLKLPRTPLLYISILCLLFIPAAGLHLRLIRTTLFGAMALYSLIFMTALVVYVATQQNRTWLWAFFTGVSIGFAVSTREEAIWLFAPAILAVTASTFFYWQKSQTIKIFFLILVLVLGYQIPLTAFSSLNFNSYDIFSPSLRQHRSYQNFYSLLSSIEPSKRSRYIPISTETRELTYRYSPKFSELRPFLEGPPLDSLANNTQHHKLAGWGKQLSTREFFVSTFEWALAKAIFLSGNKTANDFISFCNSATNEIQLAIDSGKIKAGSKGLGLLPPLPISDTPKVAYATYRSIKLLLWPQKVERKYNNKPNPDPIIASNWHAMLGTSPSNSIIKSTSFPDMVFNKFLINAFKVSYGLVFIITLISLMILLRKERQKGLILFALVTISAGAVTAFSIVMGIIDTIAWPTLKWGGGYNAMGQFPLHYLLLISSVIILHSMQVFRIAKPS